MDVEHVLRNEKFVWNASKEIINARKHGVSFFDACEVFFDDDSMYVDATSGDEERSAVIGCTAKSRVLYVVHLITEEDWIRIISAREATPQEVRAYENS